MTALKRRQIGAIVALSYARIFFRNSINLGIPLFESPEIVASIQDGDEVTLDIPNHCIIADERVYELPPLPKFAQEIVGAGGIINYVKANGRFPGEESAG